MSAYYNEIDRYCCDRLQDLMDGGLIATGKIDDRSIANISAADLAGFERVHFFAGIGGWDLALQLAEWPRGRTVWTGSCPCQPFSAAGSRRGAADKRHLWPEFHRIIQQCRPAVIFGEQVASPAGRQWFSGVRADLEGMEYAMGGADLCAAGIKAPHMRQRLFFVADAANSERRRRECGTQETIRPEEIGRRGSSLSSAIGLADADGGDARSERQQRSGQQRQFAAHGGNSPWDRYDVVTDGKKSWRIEPGSFPLVDGVPNRLAQLRGFGNAIVPQLGAEFVSAYLEIEREMETA